MSTTISVAIDHTKVFNSILKFDIRKCALSIYLASIIKKEDLPRFERIDISTGIMDEFGTIIEKRLQRYQKELSTETLLFHEYAIESKPEDYEIEHINLSAYPLLKEQIDMLSSLPEIEGFKADEQFLAGLRFYVIVAQPDNGDPIYFFRTYTPQKLLCRSKLIAFLNHGVYDRMQEPLLLFDEEVDCMSRGDSMFIFNKTPFENTFHFFEKIKIAAQDALDVIKIQVPIQNFEEFAGTCQNHPTKLRKLKNIAGKSELHQISMSHIKAVIKQQKLPVEVVEKNGTEMLIYDKRQPWVILNLLEDNYLWSLLTEQSYEVTGKRKL